MTGETYFLDRDIREVDLIDLTAERDQLLGKLYHVDARLRVVARELAVQHGYSARTISRLTGISRTTITRWIR